MTLTKEGPVRRSQEREWFQWLAEQLDRHSKAPTSLAVGAHEAYRDQRP